MPLYVGLFLFCQRKHLVQYQQYRDLKQVGSKDPSTLNASGSICSFLKTPTVSATSKFKSPDSRDRVNNGLARL